MELTMKTGGAFLGAARSQMEGLTVKVKIIHDCIVDREYRHVGDIVEVTDKVATTLVGLLRAVYLKDRPAKADETPATTRGTGKK